MKALTIAVALAGGWAGSAHADTLGMFPCTAPVAHWESATVMKDGPTIVVRDAGTWAAVWKATGMRGPLPAVDFAHAMVVGLANGPKDDRAIYRIELDNVAAPTKLLVRAGIRGAPCGGVRVATSSRVQLVETPRSLLPITWVTDEMIDAGSYIDGPRGNEGVDTTVLGVEKPATRTLPTKGTTIAPPPPPPAPPPVPPAPSQVPPPSGAQGPGCCKPSEIVTTREAAETRVFAQLTKAEIAKLSTGPMGHPMARVPHGWTRLAVTYAAGVWTVAYDDLAFTVDANTGRVSR